VTEQRILQYTAHKKLCQSNHWPFHHAGHRVTKLSCHSTTFGRMVI